MHMMFKKHRDNDVYCTLGVNICICISLIFQNQCNNYDINFYTQAFPLCIFVATYIHALLCLRSKFAFQSSNCDVAMHVHA